MFDLGKTKKKVVIRDGKRLLVDFDSNEIEKPNKQEFVIEEEKKKEDIKKPVIKKKQPNKGKSLF